jgi:hypothetical protein
VRLNPQGCVFLVMDGAAWGACASPAGLAALAAQRTGWSTGPQAHTMANVPPDRAPLRPWPEHFAYLADAMRQTDDRSDELGALERWAESAAPGAATCFYELVWIVAVDLVRGDREGLIDCFVDEAMLEAGWEATWLGRR